MGKLLILITSLIYASLAAEIVSYVVGTQGLVGLLYFVAFAAMNPFIVLFSASISEAIYRWAYPNSGNWGKGARMFIGAFWPATLPLYLIIFFILGVINRIFR